MLTPIHPAFQLLLALLVTLAAISDLRTRRIPNALVLAGSLLGFSVQLFLFRLPGLRTAALGFGLGFILYLPLWLLGARGAGDVKLLAAAGSFLGPANTLTLFIVAAILGGVLALMIVLIKGRTRQTAANVAVILSDLFRLRRPAATVRDPRALRLPHAPVIALATFAILAIAIRGS
ncbi:MAG: peptidase prepilin type [Bryobacterales bacterium]|nr:peptidase prepilin type [Bryobacterales bacterium]